MLSENVFARIVKRVDAITASKRIVNGSTFAVAADEADAGGLPLRVIHQTKR